MRPKMNYVYAIHEFHALPYSRWHVRTPGMTQLRVPLDGTFPLQPERTAPDIARVFITPYRAFEEKLYTELDGREDWDNLPEVYLWEWWYIAEEALYDDLEQYFTEHMGYMYSTLKPPVEGAEYPLARIEELPKEVSEEVVSLVDLMAAKEDPVVWG